MRKRRTNDLSKETVPVEEPWRIVEPVSAAASAHPDAVAVRSAIGSLTYGELERRSSALATELNWLEVGPEVVVALVQPRSLAMVVGALGIMKAGGAYLPIDPSEPERRIEFLIEDAQARVVIAPHRPEGRDVLPGRPVIELDDFGRIKRDEPGDPTAKNESVAGQIGRTGNAEQLAYIIYTSGSTGEPKGVEITCGSLAHLVQWHLRTFGIRPFDRATQLARVSFDAAVWEIWPYLCAGASLHIPPEPIVHDPERLRDWLVEEAITISFVPTPLAERLLTLSWPTNTCLRTMLTGGDALHYYPAAGLPFRLINNYGPTECTVVSTSAEIPAETSAGRLPPIGKAIGETVVYVLDRNLRPVSCGTTGELYIGGPGVGRGYRNRPELTAARFVPNPSAMSSGARLFKTGDLVKELADGQLAFMGRLDEQVKIRGFRVEPHEIVAALDAHPGILQSAVVAREFGPDDRRLVAYVVCREGIEPSARAVREFIGKRLPDYMVPSLFVRMDGLPLTANGKVDVGALPGLEQADRLPEELVAQPGSNTELTIAGILAPLLALPAVDVRANFFALGGHSLLGTQLIVRLRNAFGVELPLRAVFEAPTIAGLAAVIDRLLFEKVQARGAAETLPTGNIKRPAFAA